MFMASAGRECALLPHMGAAAASHLSGIVAAMRPGVPRTITDVRVEEVVAVVVVVVVVRILDEIPEGSHALVQAGAGPPIGVWAGRGPSRRWPMVRLPLARCR
jgi:hypothetical protein